jgi:hypothetical protein
MRDHIRTWQQDGFRLELFDTYQTDRYGKSVLAYDFYHHDELIFEGADYHVSPMHAIDGDESVSSLLAFLSLKPGDTDPEYFESYTPRQLEWCKAHGEELNLIVFDMEEAAAEARKADTPIIVQNKE